MLVLPQSHLCWGAAGAQDAPLTAAARHCEPNANPAVRGAVKPALSQGHRDPATDDEGDKAPSGSAPSPMTPQGAGSSGGGAGVFAAAADELRLAERVTARLDALVYYCSCVSGHLERLAVRQGAPDLGRPDAAVTCCGHVRAVDGGGSGHSGVWARLQVVKAMLARGLVRHARIHLVDVVSAPAIGRGHESPAGVGLAAWVPWLVSLTRADSREGMEGGGGNGAQAGAGAAAEVDVEEVGGGRMTAQMEADLTQLNRMFPLDRRLGVPQPAAPVAPAAPAEQVTSRGAGGVIDDAQQQGHAADAGDLGGASSSMSAGERRSLWWQGLLLRFAMLARPQASRTRMHAALPALINVCMRTHAHMKQEKCRCKHTRKHTHTRTHTHRYALQESRALRERVQAHQFRAGVREPVLSLVLSGFGDGRDPIERHGAGNGGAEGNGDLRGKVRARAGQVAALVDALAPRTILVSLALSSSSEVAGTSPLQVHEGLRDIKNAAVAGIREGAAAQSDAAALLDSARWVSVSGFSEGGGGQGFEQVDSDVAVPEELLSMMLLSRSGALVVEACTGATRALVEVFSARMAGVDGLPPHLFLGEACRWPSLG